MVRTLAVTHDFELIQDIPLEKLSSLEIQWYWVDFSEPTEEESMLLESHFHFHPLAVEDCFHWLQRPKLDHYGDNHFFVLHSLTPGTLAAEEIDLFWCKHFIVTFHKKASSELDDAWKRISEQRELWEKGHVYAAYLVMDKLVDQYFPSVFKLEDQLSGIELNHRKDSIQTLMNAIFEIRTKLLKLRKTIIPMRDLLYQTINSDRFEDIKDYLFYFTDVYDHLLKLSELVEENREMTADMRDSYVSISANRMSAIMKTLTVITTIFMPLSFIAGVYGMNFDNMPELHWRWGYLIVLLVMFSVGLGMYAGFRKKGWFK